jgi:PhzF family phenazine biosynthesis protein
MRRFAQVDVFGESPLAGNPVAVVLDAEGLSDADMAALARWTNLSETTFVLPSERADYRVRIFTPGRELPFAGHPTLGTCHAWLEATGAAGDAFVQECEAGQIGLRRIDGRLGFAAPALLRDGPVAPEDAAQVAAFLGDPEIVDMRWADNGPGWIAVLLADPEAVLSVRPGDAPLNVGVAAASADHVEVRVFFGKDGAPAEDPVTGSFNASLAQWLLGAGRIEAPYVAHQGTGRVHVSVDGGDVWVAGATTTVFSGTAALS